MKVSLKRLRETAKLPVYATAGAAGMDLHADLTDTVPELGVMIVVIPPGERRMISTGIAIAVPEGFEAQCRPRSGLAAKHGITVANAPGTIDSDYRGEIKVILINHGDEEFLVNQHDRIAQLIIAPVMRAELVEVDALPDTARGEGGFGSTGVEA